MQKLDSEAAKTWIYPTNYPVREYQLSITSEAMFRNTLVVLPTGLGKTLIASVVMFNYYRWFPQGLVVFMAPTKPLVQQQVEACFKVMGIPEHETALMDGSMSPSKRSQVWADARVVFCTPQVMDNDISKSRVPSERLTCIVVDEAHKATGSFAYVNVVQQLAALRRSRGDSRDTASGFRVLALSATPGSDTRKIQEVVTNLEIEHIECRFEDDVDVVGHTFDKLVESVAVAAPKGGNNVRAQLKKLFNALLVPPLKDLVADNVLQTANPDNLNVMVLNEAVQRVREMYSTAVMAGDILMSIRRQEVTFRVDLCRLLLDARNSATGDGGGSSDSLALLQRAKARAEQQLAAGASQKSGVSTRVTLSVRPPSA
jgi:Fanconi anemia group M protein